MAAVTQRVPNYLGGVSKQSDDKKLPNQVKVCLNGYPDPTFGLTKRPGFKWISNLGTGTTYDNSKWNGSEIWWKKEYSSIQVCMDMQSTPMSVKKFLVKVLNKAALSAALAAESTSIAASKTPGPVSSCNPSKGKSMVLQVSRRSW